jgi:hypothetical protein
MASLSANHLTQYTAMRFAFIRPSPHNWTANNDSNNVLNKKLKQKITCSDATIQLCGKLIEKNKLNQIKTKTTQMIISIKIDL